MGKKVMAIRSFKTVLGLLGLMAAISACQPISSLEQDPQPDTKAAAESISKKIVALTSISADIVHNLDDNALVGIPGSSLLTDDPRFEGLTAVSSGRAEPDLEKIVALKPDLVIGADGFHDKVLDRLTDLDVNVLAIDIDGWESLKTITQVLATQLDADPTELVERYDACLAAAPDQGPSAIVLASREPLLSPNKESWAGDFLEKFNVQNMTADLAGQSEFQGYITLSPEKVLEMNPEQLLFIDSGGNVEDEIAQLKADPFWGKLAAVQSDQVYSVDYHGLINPGSIKSIEQVCENFS